MKNKIIVSGSIAYDVLYRYDKPFQDSLDTGKEHVSVSFVVSEKSVHFGGCGGNIAYNLSLLGCQPILIGIVGKDFDGYGDYLQAKGISTRHLIQSQDTFTSQASIVSDPKGQQLMFFYSGADDQGALFAKQLEEKIERASVHASLAIVSPNSIEVMKTSMHAIEKYGIPFIFDPGQQIPRFTGSELLSYAKKSLALVLNDYEWSLFQQAVHIPEDVLLADLGTVIITRGEAGSELYFQGQTVKIAAAMGGPVVDPTGCGDAYRGGILWALSGGKVKNQDGLSMDLLKLGAEKGTHLAAACLSSVGTQNHVLS